MNLVRKQSETGCSVDGECRAEEKPYNYKDDPFYQYLAGVVARGRRARTKEGRNKRRRARRANDLDFRLRGNEQIWMALVTSAPLILERAAARMTT